MSRSKIRPIEQPDEVSCGPASLHIALKLLGKRSSVTSLYSLCQTTKYGTTTRKMLGAIKKLGLSVLMLERATLRHLLSSLKEKNRAVLVSYLYDQDAMDKPDHESGHWAVVSSFSVSRNRIVLFDSYSGQRKSYSWAQFRTRWIDYELKRRHLGARKKKYEVIRKWQPQLMMVLADKTTHLPRFGLRNAKIFAPSSARLVG